MSFDSIITSAHSLDLWVTVISTSCVLSTYRYSYITTSTILNGVWKKKDEANQRHEYHDMNTTHEQIPTLVLDRTSPIDTELVFSKLPSEGHFGRIRLRVKYLVDIL
jgi:hypothetical protein